MTTPTDHDRRVAEEAARTFSGSVIGRSDASDQKLAAIILAAADKIAAERVKELEKDKERLDWVQETLHSVNFYLRDDENGEPTIPTWIVLAEPLCKARSNLRAAIDAARAKEESR